MMKACVGSCRASIVLRIQYSSALSKLLLHSSSVAPVLASCQRVHPALEVYNSWANLYAGGLGIGLAFGIACRYILRFMRWMNATIDQQVSLTLALAYLSYYTANSPARVSGIPHLKERLIPGKLSFSVFKIVISFSTDACQHMRLWSGTFSKVPSFLSEAGRLGHEQI